MPNDEKDVHKIVSSAQKADWSKVDPSKVDWSKVDWGVDWSKITWSGILQGLYTVGTLMEPAVVLIMCGRIDRALKEALLSKMRQLDNTDKAQLFEGYGPLATFSAKLLMAYSLSIFDEQIYADLKVIKKIRNNFAHPPKLKVTELTSFANDPVLSICKKFKNYDQTEQPFMVFLRRAAQCLLAVSKDDAEDIEVATRIMTFPKVVVPAPSPDKSS